MVLSETYSKKRTHNIYTNTHTNELTKNCVWTSTMHVFFVHLLLVTENKRQWTNIITHKKSRATRMHMCEWVCRVFGALRMLQSDRFKYTSLQTQTCVHRSWEHYFGRMTDPKENISMYFGIYLNYFVYYMFQMIYRVRIVCVRFFSAWPTFFQLQYQLRFLCFYFWY